MLSSLWSIVTVLLFWAACFCVGLWAVRMWVCLEELAHDVRRFTRNYEKDLKTYREETTRHE